MNPILEGLSSTVWRLSWQASVIVILVYDNQTTMLTWRDSTGLCEKNVSMRFQLTCMRSIEGLLHICDTMWKRDITSGLV